MVTIASESLSWMPLPVIPTLTDTDPSRLPSNVEPRVPSFEIVGEVVPSKL
jgi:hypothetical protein